MTSETKWIHLAEDGEGLRSDGRGDEAKLNLVWRDRLQHLHVADRKLAETTRCHEAKPWVEAEVYKPPTLHSRQTRLRSHPRCRRIFFSEAARDILRRYGHRAGLRPTERLHDLSDAGLARQRAFVHGPKASRDHHRVVSGNAAATRQLLQGVEHGDELVAVVLVPAREQPVGEAGRQQGVDRASGGGEDLAYPRGLLRRRLLLLLEGEVGAPQEAYQPVEALANRALIFIAASTAEIAPSHGDVCHVADEDQHLLSIDGLGLGQGSGRPGPLGLMRQRHWSHAQTARPRAKQPKQHDGLGEVAPIKVASALRRLAQLRGIVPVVVEREP
mmetsp:Transcript_97744/g.272998  ORF Transcript_97744/g.272998 Transcript_97744/m.272998 type:complete len:330 (-) Transcript_97744:1123-2112(-)